MCWRRSGPGSQLGDRSPPANGGDDIKVNWTVENAGNGPAQPTGWIDTVYLTNDPTDPLDQNAITMTLGSVEHDTVLNSDACYNASLSRAFAFGPGTIHRRLYRRAQPTVHTPYNVVEEVSETNNLKAVASIVTPVPADLVVTNVSIPTANYSGESMTFSYTVENEGTEPGLGRNRLLDRLHLGLSRADLQPIRRLFHGADDSRPDTPLLPGQSYTINFTVTIPPGTGGQYYL